MPNISFRFFNAYGLRSRTTGAYGAVFGVFLAQKFANKPLTVVGNGKQTRDFIHVNDLVEALYLSAKKKSLKGEIFNLGSGKETSVNYIAKIIGGKKVFIPKRPSEPDRSLADIKKDWCFTADYILEKKVDLKKEISVVIASFSNGETYTYEPIENVHKDQILKHSKIPADISSKIFQEAQLNAKLIAEKLGYVGVMCVEYFIDQNDNLLTNEIAPRVHNSGHLTINAYNISQFENHIRAICGLGKQELKKLYDAKMINIIGEEIVSYRSKKYSDNEFFFDYGKKEIKANRKMGHLTVIQK